MSAVAVLDDRPVTRTRRADQPRLIGALFLAGFLTYGIGFGLVTSVVGAPDRLGSVSAHHATLVLGCLLMLANSVVDVGKGVLFFPVLQRHDPRAALVYLSTMVVEVVLLAVGVLCILVLVPLAGQHAGTGAGGWASGAGSVALDANTAAYNVAELILGLGCLFLCTTLLRTGLVPRLLAVWGLAGYALLMTGALAELCGVHAGLALSIPGGLLELALGIRLLTRGFDRH